MNTPLQEAIQSKRYETICLAGFSPDKPLPQYLQSKLDTYLQSYAEWYLSKYGENGKPHGSTLRVMTDSENKTYAEWEQATKDYWYLEHEKLDSVRTAMNLLIDLEVPIKATNIRKVLSYISERSYADTDIERLMNKED